MIMIKQNIKNRIGTYGEFIDNFKVAVCELRRKKIRYINRSIKNARGKIVKKIRCI